LNLADICGRRRCGDTYRRRIVKLDSSNTSADELKGWPRGWIARRNTVRDCRDCRREHTELAPKIIMFMLPDTVQRRKHGAEILRARLMLERQAISATVRKIISELLGCTGWAADDFASELHATP